MSVRNRLLFGFLFGFGESCSAKDSMLSDAPTASAELRGNFRSLRNSQRKSNGAFGHSETVGGVPMGLSEPPKTSSEKQSHFRSVRNGRGNSPEVFRASETAIGIPPKLSECPKAQLNPQTSLFRARKNPFDSTDFKLFKLDGNYPLVAKTDAKH